MKIYVSDYPDALMGDIKKNDLPFHLERDRWEFVDSIEQADVVPILRMPMDLHDLKLQFSLQDQLDIIRPHKDKIFLLMFHNHISESMGGKAIQMYLSDYTDFKNVYAVSVNLVNTNRQISYNYYYDWVKAHFTQYTKHELKFGRMWVAQCTRDSFVLPNINPFVANKKFCIPNYVRPPKTPEYMEFKNYARDVLSSYINSEDSYYSDFRRNVQLMPEEASLYPSAYRGTENGQSGVGIIPIRNEYFTDSIISVFVESVARRIKIIGDADGVLAFTEKTYIPLVKGHFILPFGSVGIIEELKKQGFMFPEWIDYSYDLIDNDEARLKAFINSFVKLQKIDIHRLNYLANQDIEIRKHNRRIIMKSGFDSLYDKVKNLG